MSSITGADGPVDGPVDGQDGQVDGQVDGRVESVTDGVVEGWAWRPGDPAQRVTVRVLLDGEAAGHAIADLMRPSLAAAGIGDGLHAFRFALPSAAPGARECVLRVEAAPDDPLPPASGFTVVYPGGETEDRGPWYGVRFRVDHPRSRRFEPAVDGRVEQIEDGVLEGWAWLPSVPGERVVLRVLLDGIAVGTSVADLLRPSLATAGIGDGRHAFRFAIPVALATPGPHTVRVQSGGDPLIAATAFRVAEAARSDDPWYGARFEVDDAPAGAAPGIGGPAPGGDGGPDGDPDDADADAVPTPRVTILGRDGWRFQALALVLAADAESAGRIEGRVAVLLDRLDQLGGRLRELGVRLLPVVIPIKEHVHGELLPAGVRETLGVRPGWLLARGLVDHPVLEALDLLLALDAGSDRWPVYLPAAEGLSEWGVYCAYRAVIKRVAEMVAGVPPPVELEESSVVVAPSRPVTEAVATIDRDGILIPCAPDDVPPPPEQPIVVAPPGGAERTPPEHLSRLRARLALGWEQPLQRSLARAMFVGDERQRALVEWAGRHFRYTLLVGRDAPLVDLVSLERPDVLVFVIDERSLLEGGTDDDV